MPLHILQGGMTHFQMEISGRTIEDMVNKYLLPKMGNEYLHMIDQVQLTAAGQHNAITLGLVYKMVDLATFMEIGVPDNFILQASVVIEINENRLFFKNLAMKNMDGEIIAENPLGDLLKGLDGIGLPSLFTDMECKYLLKLSKYGNALLGIGLSKNSWLTTTYSYDDFFRTNTGLVTIPAKQDFAFSFHQDLVKYLLYTFIYLYNANPLLDELINLDEDSTVVSCRNPFSFLFNTSATFLMNRSFDGGKCEVDFSAEANITPHPVLDSRYIGNKYAFGGDLLISVDPNDLDAIVCTFLAANLNSLKEAVGFLLPALSVLGFVIGGPGLIDALVSYFAGKEMRSLFNVSNRHVEVDLDNNIFFVRLAHLIGLGFVYPLHISSQQDEGITVHPAELVIISRGTSRPSGISNNWHPVFYFNPFTLQSIKASPNSLQFDIHSPKALQEMGYHYPDKKSITIENTNLFPVAIRGWEMTYEEDAPFKDFFTADPSVPVIIMPESKIEISIEFGGNIFDKEKNAWIPACFYESTEFFGFLKITLLHYNLDAFKPEDKFEEKILRVRIYGHSNIDFAYSDFLKNRYLALFEKNASMALLKAYYSILGSLQNAAEILEDQKPYPEPNAWVSVNVYCDDPGVKDFEIHDKNRNMLAKVTNPVNSPMVSVLVAAKTKCFVQCTPKRDISSNYVWISKDYLLPLGRIDFAQPVRDFVLHYDQIIAITKNKLMMHQYSPLGVLLLTFTQVFDENLLGIRDLPKKTEYNEFLIWGKNKIFVLQLFKHKASEVIPLSLNLATGNVIKDVSVIDKETLSINTTNGVWNARIDINNTQVVMKEKPIYSLKNMRESNGCRYVPVVFLDNKIQSMKRKGNIAFLLTQDKKQIIMYNIKTQKTKVDFFNIT